MTSAGRSRNPNELDGADHSRLPTTHRSFDLPYQGSNYYQDSNIQRSADAFPASSSLGPHPTPPLHPTQRTQPVRATGHQEAASPSTSLHRMAPSTATKPQIEDIPVTYTPTTHRISKAKKGKKVHVCEYGCGKIFTRAEHRKRHEANHLKDPLYKCSVAGCEKPFQRIDLLNRHLERQHGIQNPGGPNYLQGRRASSVPSSSNVHRSPLLAVNTQVHTTPSPSLANVPHPEAPPYLTSYGYPARAQTMPLDRRSPVSSAATSATVPSNYEYSSAPGSAQSQNIYSPPGGYYGNGTTNDWGYAQPSMMYPSGNPSEVVTTTVDAAQNYLSYHHPQVRMGLGLDDSSFNTPSLVRQFYDPSARFDYQN